MPRRWHPTRCRWHSSGGFASPNRKRSRHLGPPNWPRMRRCGARSRQPGTCDRRVRAGVGGGPHQRSAYLGQHHRTPYGLATDVLMRLHRRRPADGFDRQAFGVSERARARTLLDLIAESRSNIREGVDPALLSREQTLRAQLSLRRDDSDERVEGLLIQFRELQNEMRARNPRYASLVEPPIAELATIQRELLDRDTALVEYALGEERSYVWIVDATSLTSHELPPRARIEALARRAHAALSRAQAPDLRVRLQELSDAIVTPIAARIAGKRLAIVTEGTLQYIPFAALLGRSAVRWWPRTRSSRCHRRRPFALSEATRSRPPRAAPCSWSVIRSSTGRIRASGAARRRARRRRARSSDRRAIPVSPISSGCCSRDARPTHRVARAGQSRPQAAGLRRQPRAHHQRRSVRIRRRSLRDARTAQQQASGVVGSCVLARRSARTAAQRVPACLRGLQPADERGVGRALRAARRRSAKTYAARAWSV